jgi:hypothetical protein
MRAKNHTDEIMSQTTQTTDEALEAILLQYIAEYHQGLNELAGHGTATEQAIQKLKQLLLEERINENESLLSVAEHEIDLGDKCYNHDKYTSACYACRKRKMYVEYSKDWQGSINERLQQLHHQTDNERSE